MRLRRAQSSSRQSASSSGCSSASRPSTTAVSLNSPRPSRQSSLLRQEIDLTEEADTLSLLPSDTASLLPSDSASNIPSSSLSAPPSSLGDTSSSQGPPSTTRSQTQRSWVWTYFTALSDNQHVQCGFTGSSGKACNKLLKRDRTCSTKSMRDHLIGVHKVNDPQKETSRQATLDGMLLHGQEPIEKRLTSKTVKTMMVYLISECDLAISLTERKSFREFMELMFPGGMGFQHKRRAITEHLEQVYHFHKGWIQSKVLPSTKALACTLDTWTAPNRVAFLGITAHFIDRDFTLQRCTLGLREIIGDHSGANLGQHFFDCLCDFEAIGQLRAITADNASNNTTLASWLSMKLGDRFNANTDLIGCMAHTINLAAQAGLKMLGVGDEEEIATAAADAAMVRNPMMIGYLVDTPDGARINAQSLITRIHGLATHIRGSPQRVAEFKSLVAVYPPEDTLPDAGPPPDMLLVNQRTRWNSTHSMLERAYLLREAYNRYCMRREETKFAISELEWTKVQQMLDFLEPLHQATDLLCSEKYPTLNMVIPMYISLIEKLTEAQLQYDSSQLGPSGDAMIEKLEKYLVKTMGKPGAVCSTILDPRIKLTYFKNHERTLQKYGFSVNEQRETFEAYAMVVDGELKKASRAKDAMAVRGREQTSSGGQATATSGACGPLSTSPRKGKGRRKPFFAPVFVGPDLSQDTAENEVNRYFAEGVEDAKLNILEYWKARATSFPILSRMACQFLCIPATSAPSESIFSGGRKILSYQRFSLSPEHVEMLLSVKNWYRTHGSLYLGRES